jgi:hypothetical protein
MTPHFIVSVARGPEVSKVRLFITPICGLRMTVVKYLAPKAPLQCKRCHRFRHMHCNCGYAPDASRVGVPTTPMIALPVGDSLSAVAAGATTQQTTVAV